MQNSGHNVRSSITPVVKVLLIANVIVFFSQSFLSKIIGSDVVFSLGLVPILVFEYGKIWQLVTHLFLHGDITHIFFNMFALFIFGPHLEKTLGAKGFFKFYLFTGIGAALLHLLLTSFSDEAYLTPTIGASGAIFGILGGFAYFYPQAKIYILGIFPAKAWVLIAIYGCYELFLLLAQGTNSLIAHGAHLGGLITGLLYLQVKYNKYSLSSLSQSKIKQNNIYSHLDDDNRKYHYHQQQKNYYETSSTEDSVIEKVNQLQHIIDKLNKNGYSSLTEQEKTILKEFQSRKTLM